jgi:hypothetical protein
MTSIGRRLLVATAVALLFMTGQHAHPAVVVSSGLPVRSTSPLKPARQTGPDVVFAFEELLGHHTTLVARLMRGELRDDPDFTQAANDAVVHNTDELSALIGSLHGPAAVEAFRRLWGRHVDLFFDYANALADDDDEGRAQAQAGLDGYRAEWGTFVESATGGAIPAATASDNLGEHLAHLTGHADLYAADDYAGAFQLVREGYAHMFPTGRALAGGLAPTPTPELPVTVDDPSFQLRSALGRLMGEHFELAVDTMRSGVAGEADFDGVAEALDDNSREFTGAVDSLFGAERAAAFNQAWATHIDALVDYTTATAERNEAAKKSAVTEMEQIRQVLAASFSELTGGRVPVDVAATTLTTHDDHLIRQVEAYAQGDYEEAHLVSNEGYAHMFDAAAALAGGFEAALTPAMPAGAPQTGGGGMAPVATTTSCRLP